MTPRKATWMFGGFGLIACAVLGTLGNSLLGTPAMTVVHLIRDVVYAASVLLLTIGLSPRASVVARRPLGTTALVIVAIWPLISSAATLIPAFTEPGDAALAFGYVSLVVPLFAGLIAAVQIARAGVLPSPWRWAPLAALVLAAAAWAIPNAMIAAVDPASIQQLAGLFFFLSNLAFLAGTLGLGIAAVVLAAAQREDSVEVYRSE